MSRNTITRDRDGNWGEIHDRLAAADAKRRLELDSLIRRQRPPCACCGKQLNQGESGYCYAPACRAERRRVEYQRARQRGESVEGSRC